MEIQNDNVVIYDFVRPYADAARKIIPKDPSEELKFDVLREYMGELISGKDFSEGMDSFLALWAIYIWKAEGLI